MSSFGPESPASLPEGPRAPDGRGSRSIGRFARKRWVLAAGTIVVVGAAAGVAIADPFAGGGPARAGVVDNGYPTSTATVQRETLSSQVEESATLGLAGSYSIAIPTGTAESALEQAQSTAQSDEEKVANDEQALAAARQQERTSGASTLMAAKALLTEYEQELSTAESQLAADRQLDCPAVSSTTVGTPISGASPSGGNTGSPSGDTGSPSGDTGSPSSSTTTTTPSSGDTGSPSGSGDTGSPSGDTGSNPSGSSTTTTTPGGSGDTGSPSGDTGSSPSGSSTTTTTPGGSSTTTSDPPTDPPGKAATVTTGSATVTGSGSADLSGTVDPNGSSTSYSFEYGTSGAFGSQTPSVDAGDGTASVDASAQISGLRPDTTYSFALVATNASGTVVGNTVTFQSGASSCVEQRQVVDDDLVSVAEQKDTVSSDEMSAGSSVTSDEQTLANDEQAASSANQALSEATELATNSDATFTSLPEVGQVVRRGQAVYALDGRSVPLFYGDVPPWRALYLGVSPGADVKQLEENLVALGFGNGLVPSDQFTAATEAAVKAWQASLGAPETGMVALGDVVVEPGPIEVDTVTPTLGETATAGGAVLTATSTKIEVTIDLDASQQGEVKVGDPVSIVLPDNSTTPGVVSSVGTVATTPSSSGNNGSSTPTVTVEVTPTKLSQIGDLDQASVNVWITQASAPNALVVPVDALLALSSGGYAIEVVEPGGAHQLEAVSLGLFDDANEEVQVSGSGVQAGQKIVVPNL